MLPVGAEYAEANFLTPFVVEAVEARLAQANAGGLVDEDRLRRNLLSSQPMCFNLFGHLQADPAALLAWVQLQRPDAAGVTRVEVEWAPPKEEHFGGGSAFDAFVEYELASGERGFLGIECKYAEHLPKTDVKNVRPPYKDFTAASGRWKPDAAVRLDRTGLRQFWLNTLLAQSRVTKSDYVEGRCIVMACEGDVAAHQAADDVRGELVDEGDLAWSSYEDLVATATAERHAGWRHDFVERYLELSPTAHLA